jgi:hypothetical protein
MLRENSGIISKGIRCIIEFPYLLLICVAEYFKANNSKMQNLQAKSETLLKTKSCELMYDNLFN